MTWFPVASQLRLHRVSLWATVLCADLQESYAPFVPERTVDSAFFWEIPKADLW